MTAKKKTLSKRKVNSRVMLFKIFMKLLTKQGIILIKAHPGLVDGFIKPGKAPKKRKKNGS